jgi:hypothetical protein
MLSKQPAARPDSGNAVLSALRALGDLGAEAQERASTNVPALTQGEQRYLSVVLAGGASHALHAPVWADPTITPEQAAGTQFDLSAVVAPFGATLHRLADGSVVAPVAAKGSAMDQAAQAARCALALRAHLRDVPMALATGRGNVATKLPVGEVIDRAARILARSTAGETGGRDDGPRPIRLDEVTAGLLDLRFDVSGDSRGLELRGEREVVETTRTLLGKPTPCVGRERGLLTLRGVFEECVAEPVARVVLVTAPAGVGKSRVGTEFLRGIAGQEVDVWMGRGDPMSAGSPFGLLAQALRRTGGLRDGEPAQVRQKKLRARVARHVPAGDQQRVTEFLAEVVGCEFPDDASVALRAARQSAVVMGDHIRRAWEDFVAAECAAHPVVLVLEDLQWGDLPTTKLVDSALKRASDLPLLVLAIARPDVTQIFPNLWAGRPVTQLQLSDLSRKAGEKLVRQVLGDAVAPELVARLLERAAGNAFYLEELIRAAFDGKGDALPETVLAMVPLILGTLWTVALMQLAGIKFNLVNVWALPLIIGSAAEYGVNIVLRYLESPAHGGGPRLARSTVMGVVFNGLTTIAGFGSLLVAHHRGVWSLGLLLVIGSAATLAASLIVLPTLVHLAGEPLQSPADRPGLGTVSASTGR